MGGIIWFSIEMVYLSGSTYIYEEDLTLHGNRSVAKALIEEAPWFIFPYPGQNRYKLLSNRICKFASRMFYHPCFPLGQWGFPSISFFTFSYILLGSIQAMLFQLVCYFAVARIAQVSIPPRFAINRGKRTALIYVRNISI